MPLAGGAVALAIGALIGAATPLGDAERDALAGVADKASDSALSAASRGADAVAAKAEALH